MRILTDKQAWQVAQARINLETHGQLGVNRANALLQIIDDLARELTAAKGLTPARGQSFTLSEQEREGLIGD